MHIVRHTHILIENGPSRSFFHFPFPPLLHFSVCVHLFALFLSLFRFANANRLRQKICAFVSYWERERESECCESICFSFVVTWFWCHVVGDVTFYEMKISNPKSWASCIRKCVCVCSRLNFPLFSYPSSI